ncbi:MULTISPECIES: hypothetical protein [Xanthomonas]|uniref:Lipoprotein n=1 Tax=Xanthomonas cucurbitae TaxID=56453 RepID=A0ABY7Y8E5_9XANT|nr:hypothetical protein [Xanthomonas cucurbitae]WDM66247.1 hypothetical protein K6981_11775 [Xanthomonas cucurbitae]WDM70125.1 hypothetical protein K6978_11745 [Xanthomonas cucurbitae]WDM77075.1 hypothetical protein K6982_09110 [Xanthomonas cucurbitae]
MCRKYFLLAFIALQNLLVGCTSKDGKALGVESFEQEKPPGRGDIVANERKDLSSELSALASIKQLKEGMVYGQIRRIVVSGGWRPKQNPDCKKDLVGRNFEEICSSNPSLCKKCDSLPELSQCSADGHCLSEFVSSDGKQLLKVATYGEIGDAKVEERDRGLPVSWWNVEEIKK